MAWARRERAERLYETIAGLAARPLSLMEVCGTHTMAIGRFGLRRRLPGNLRLLSGPGCPVCVTSAAEIDRIVAMAREPGVTVATFGDMLRVPGSQSSLERERARGGDVRLVYSPSDVLEMARAEPRRIFVFMGVGFETTSPTVAATLVRAARTACNNLVVLPAFKLVPPALRTLIAFGDASIHGFICPGHVSAVIGTRPYEPLAAAGVPCVITGFEALDILEGISLLLGQLAAGRAEVEVQYRRAVPAAGNPTAQALLGRVFRACDADWRGLGRIAGSGLELAEEFSAFDARPRVPVEIPAASDPPEGCACGEIMCGRLAPTDCPRFGSDCAPTHPLGPCMVSSEGACAAYLRYGA